MLSYSIGIIPASDRQRAMAPLTMAFASDPVTRWAFPDPDRYLAHFPEFARLFGGAAFDCGMAWCSDDFVATALWLPPGVQPDEEALGGLLAKCAPDSVQEPLLAMLGQMAGYHPAEPHWYLPLIGVDPARQGRGYGSALLERALAACDAARQPAYLESSNKRNIPLYERHGFQVLGTVQAGDSPPLWPMLRKAR